MKKVIFAALVIAAFSSSCKKDSKTPTCNKTAADIAGTYSIVKVELGIGGSFSDVTAFAFDPCEKDDKIILNTDGTVTYSDAGTQCDPVGSATGSWSVSGDNITLSAGSIDVGSATISSFDCTTLVILGTDPSDPTTQYRFTVKK